MAKNLNGFVVTKSFCFRVICRQYQRGIQNKSAFCIRKCRSKMSDMRSTFATSTRIPSLSVTPQDALVDEKLQIKLTGLEQQAPVTLHASVCENKMKFGSYACYVADSRGCLDLSTQESVQGTYTGIEPMGLFWSMEQEPGQQTGLRYSKKDVTQSVDIKLNVYTGHYTWEDIYNNPLQPALGTDIKRWYKAADVTREVIRAGNIRGTLFLPPGNGPFPGVIDMFGSAGGLMEFRASLLASRGFACLALAYFGYEDLPKTLYHVGFEYFQEAINWFISQPSVIKEGIGLVGVSKGAEICQFMAIHCPEVHAFVNISGPPYCTAIPFKIKGNDVPTFVGDFERFQFVDDALIMKDGYTDFEDTPRIELWKSKAKVLNICGDDDQCVDPAVLSSHVDGYPPELRSNVETLVYPNAGHLIEPPYSPFCRSSYNKLINGIMVWGGEAKAHADAQEDSWKRILSFLRNNLVKNHTNISLNSRL